MDAFYLDPEARSPVLVTLVRAVPGPCLGSRSPLLLVRPHGDLGPALKIVNPERIVVVVDE